MRKTFYFFMFLATYLSLFQPVYAEMIFFDDFEGDWSANWHTDLGTWEVGVPTSGPGRAYSGT